MAQQLEPVTFDELLQIHLRTSTVILLMHPVISMAHETTFC